MEGKAYKLCVDIVVAAPKPERDAGQATAGIGMPRPMEGSLTAPTAPQMTDASPKQMRGTSGPSGRGGQLQSGCFVVDV